MTGPRRPGDFCWFNILTPDAGAARSFFAELFGWDYGDIPGVGHTVLVGGGEVGGLFDLNGPGALPGARPHINAMVKVEDADATVRQIRTSGGEARDAWDVMGHGRMSDCKAPDGAEFDLWQPLAKPGMEIDSQLHGAPSWFDVLTNDVGGSVAFYERVFGWRAEEMPGNGGYRVFRLGNEMVAGLMGRTPKTAGMAPFWGTYFTVRNLDACAATAQRLGASLCVPPTEVPGMLRFCGIVSPQGVMFYAVEYTG